MARSGADAPAANVILLHGFAGLPGVMHPMLWRLRREGFHAFAPWYDSWSLPMAAIVDRIAAQVARIEAVRPGVPLHFVGHSMGGLVIRALIAQERPPQLGRVVMLGTPNAGSELADLLHRWPATRAILGRAAPALLTARDGDFDRLLGRVDYPLGIIAGDRPAIRQISDQVLPLPHDGKVSVASTRLAAAQDHLVLPLSHMMLCYNASAHRQVAAFLATGSFARE